MMLFTRTLWILGFCWFLVLAPGLLGLSVAHAACQDLPGDLDNNGQVDVVDVQCGILLVLWSLGEGEWDYPACAQIPDEAADLDCSGDFDVSDLTAVATTVLGSPLAMDIDKDQNGCLDVCQCGDGICSPFECTDCPIDCCKAGVECSSSPCALGPACDNTPACYGKPCPIGDGAACDDQNFCTVGDSCTGGVCTPGPLTACDDNDVCTTDSCDPTAAPNGCSNIPIAGCSSCSNPFVPANMDCCYAHPTTKCNNTDCTACVCATDPFCCVTSWDADCQKIASKGCFSNCFCGQGEGGDCCQPHSTAGCDDSQCVMCVCQNHPECCSGQWTAICANLAKSSAPCDAFCACDSTPPVVPEPNVFCTASGSVDQVIHCKLHMVSAYEYFPRATAMQMDLSYSPDTLQFLGAYSVVCFGPNKTPPCVEVALSGKGSFPLMTGHSVSISPFDPKDWDGYGGFVIVNVSNPLSNLTNAWLDTCGEVKGDPEILNVRFKVLSDIPVNNPETVETFFFVTSKGASGTLKTQWSNANGYFVTAPK